MSTHGWLAGAAIIQFRSWHTRIWAVLLLLGALILGRLPLFGVLGFEFSFVMAIFASLAGADLGATLVWRARRSKASPIERSLLPAGAILRLWLTAAAISLLLLIPPLLVISISAIWVRNCDWLFGLKAFIAMPVLSAILASGLGVLCGLCVGKANWRPRALALLVLVISLLWSLAHFYRSPAVFSYNPIVGYFPGNLYDESIDLRAPFYWARLYHFSLLACAISAASIFLNVSELRFRRRPNPSAPRRYALLSVAISGCLVSLLYLYSGELRFSISSDDIHNALPGRYQTEHFTIIYPANEELAQRIPQIAEEHEFRRAQLVRDLDVDPPGKITSYYFINPDQKHELMGARNVYMAKPWRNEIYVHHEEFPHQVLRHEIAHVLAGSFGDSLFHVSARTTLGIPLYFNVGMIEGIAVAADWPDHFNKALTPHQSVKAMQLLDMPAPVDKLFSTGFMAFSAARGYTVAGSYLRFLLDRYGIARLRDLYKSGGDFQASYGRSQSELTSQWREMIALTELPEGAEEVIRERFRRPAIFDRPCPHAVARSRDRIIEKLAEGKNKSAISIARNVCADVPGEPRHLLRLAALLVRDSQNEEAQKIFETITQDTEKNSSSLRARALFELVALHIASGERGQAESLLRQVVAMPLGDDELRQGQVMLRVLTHQGPAAIALQEIFWNKPPGQSVDRMVVIGLAAEASAAEPTLGLAHYLLGRQLRGRGNPDATRRAFLRALSGNLSPLVTRETARLLAESAYLAGNYEDVRRACEILVAPTQPEVTRLLGYDWLERVHWKTHGQVPADPLGWRDGKTQSASTARK